MNRQEKKIQRKTLIIRTILIVGLLCLWEIAARKEWYNPFFTSYPTEILLDLTLFVKSGDLAYHMIITMREAFLGLLYGTVIGILLGVLFGQFVTLGKIFTPILTAINGIPQLTLAPVYVLWFGLGLTSKVFLAGLMVFFCVFFSTYNAIRNMEQKLIESAHILGANSIQTLWHVVLPYCMPWILSGIRSGVGACMVGAIIGEYMGASGGFGWMVTYATSFFMIRRVMSCILILLIVGLLLNWGLDFLERKVLKWKVDTRLSSAMDKK
jgi:NitT/TauT family transport system permease protein